MLAGFRGLGFGEDDYRWLTATELGDRIHVANPGGAVFTPHVARIQPAKLVTGLAWVVKSLGVRVFEHTRAHEIHPGVIRCDRGSIQAGQIVIATEGYSEAGNPLHRRLIPVQTGMVATEPLGDAQWSGLGFANNETFADCTRMSSTTLTPVSPPRVATSAKASAPAFCLAKRWLNCSQKKTLSGHKCHG